MTDEHDIDLPEVLFEFRYVGQRSVRVSAIDPRTGVEVTLVGDPTYGDEMLKRLATRKLKYVLRKKRQRPEGYY